jgi:hypothetical protein
MLLTPEFAEPQLNLTLELFLRMLVEIFGEQLLSVILHGSIVYDDLAPGYGDLDFLAVVERDLPSETCEQLIDLRKLLKNADYGGFAGMLEGTFLPRRMLNPAQPGSAFWWGTTGERTWLENRLGWITLHQIREIGIKIYGEEIQDEIPKATRSQILSELSVFCRSLEEHGRGGSLHSVDWLLIAAWGLILVNEGRYCSKSQAADWGCEHAEGEWRRQLPRARQLRLNPGLAETADWKEWLQGLDAPIREAGLELKRDLRRIGC